MIAGYGREHERGFAARRPVPKRRRWFRYYRDPPGVASKPSGNVVIIPIPTSHELASVPIDEEKRRREQQFSPTGEKGNFAPPTTFASFNHSDSIRYFAYFQNSVQLARSMESSGFDSRGDWILAFSSSILWGSIDPGKVVVAQVRTRVQFP